jgi:hypothetical protein
VYFLAPWGTQFELVSYPNGKAFENGTDDGTDNGTAFDRRAFDRRA